LLTLKTSNVNEPDIAARLRDIDADAWVVIAFGQKLGEPLLRDRFAINLHASLLPRWRGAAPINHAILAGDRETGLSVIAVAQRMDAGDVLGQVRMAIGPADTAGNLHDALSLAGPDLVSRVLVEHSECSLAPAPQDESRVTQAPKIHRCDAWINFHASSDECRRRIHAFSPAPGVSVELATSEGTIATLKLLRVEARASDPQQRTGAAPGSLVDTADGCVMCGGNRTIHLLDVQPAGGKPMTWSAFARGRSLQGALTLRSVVAPPGSADEEPRGAKQC